MSKKQVIKDIFDEKINKNCIHDNIINEISKKKKFSFNNLFKYVVTASIIFLICIFTISNSKSNMTLKGDKNINQNEIYINKIDNYNTGTLAIDIVGKAIDIDNEIYELLPFTINVNLPNDLNFSRAIEMYSRSDINDDDYSLIIGYDIMYNDSNNKDIDVFVSKTREMRIRDYKINFQELKSSKINNVDVNIILSNNFYIAFYKYNNLYFDIEARNITELEFISFIESTMK